jgi:hypothetical protein
MKIYHHQDCIITYICSNFCENPTKIELKLACPDLQNWLKFPSRHPLGVKNLQDVEIWMLD